MISQKDISYITKETNKIQNLYTEKNFEKVIEKTIKLLKKDPTQEIFYNLIGLSYRQLNNLEQAEKVFNQGLKIKPNSPSILVNLGAVYRAQGKYDEAKKTIKLALKINEKNFSALINYANIHRELNQNLEAIDYYKKALLINAENETLLINLAASYQIIGNFIESKKILNIINTKYPQNVIADKMYSSINNYEKNDTHQKKMLEKLDYQNISDEDRQTLLFSIAKSFSDQKNSEMSSKYFTIANNLKFNSFKDFNFEEETKYLTNMQYNFEDFIFDKDISSKKPELIFIVGLPRSGTTLTHQILSSHSAVFGAGELPLLNNFFLKKNLQKNFLKDITGNTDTQNEFKET